MTDPDANPRLGEVLVRTGIVSSEAVQQALATQAERNLRLGQLLVEAGAIDGSILDAVLAVHEDLLSERNRDVAWTIASRIGAIVRSQAVSREHLERAVRERQVQGVTLGEALVRAGALTREELQGVIAPR